eukprot:TRINITY_DN23622_c0_g1_i1.p1 TRINITY_DN23622_c0_g1~~TRINITY_DN23622_c0_g1_i1.p1  ORF type:complete len:800 (+),score=228.62 TRINITY_DN23622_c0_g1_i1:88-2400(+)
MVTVAVLLIGAAAAAALWHLLRGRRGRLPPPRVVAVVVPKDGRSDGDPAGVQLAELIAAAAARQGAEVVVGAVNPPPRLAACTAAGGLVAPTVAQLTGAAAACGGLCRAYVIFTPGCAARAAHLLQACRALVGSRGRCCAVLPPPHHLDGDASRAAAAAVAAGGSAGAGVTVATVAADCATPQLAAELAVAAVEEQRRSVAAPSGLAFLLLLRDAVEALLQLCYPRPAAASPAGARPGTPELTPRGARPHRESPEPQPQEYAPVDPARARPLPRCKPATAPPAPSGPSPRAGAAGAAQAARGSVHEAAAQRRRPPPELLTPPGSDSERRSPPAPEGATGSPPSGSGAEPAPMPPHSPAEWDPPPATAGSAGGPVLFLGPRSGAVYEAVAARLVALGRWTDASAEPRQRNEVAAARARGGRLPTVDLLLTERAHADAVRDNWGRSASSIKHTSKSDGHQRNAVRRAARRQLLVCSVGGLRCLTRPELLRQTLSGRACPVGTAFVLGAQGGDSRAALLGHPLAGQRVWRLAPGSARGGGAAGTVLLTAAECAAAAEAAAAQPADPTGRGPRCLAQLLAPGGGTPSLIRAAAVLTPWGDLWARRRLEGILPARVPDAGPALAAAAGTPLDQAPPLLQAQLRRSLRAAVLAARGAMRTSLQGAVATMNCAAVLWFDFAVADELEPQLLGAAAGAEQGAPECGAAELAEAFIALCVAPLWAPPPGGSYPGVPDGFECIHHEAEPPVPRAGGCCAAPRRAQQQQQRESELRAMRLM